MSIVSHTANAGQTTFNISFEYIADSHLVVSVDGSNLLSTEWTLNSVSSLELDASIVLSEGQVVTITRTTPDDLLVTFQAPAGLRPRELTLSYKQMIFLLQELKRASGQGLPLSLAGTSWLAGGLPVKGLAEPVDDNDAVTKIFLEGALQQGAGTLPEFDAEDIGLGLRVRGGAGGTSIQLSSINGQIVSFEVPQNVLVGQPPGFDGGHVIQPGGTGSSHVFSDSLERVPLVFKSQTGVPEAGAIAVAANGFDLVLPRGQWRIRAFGSVRNLNTGSSANFNGAALALTNETGLEIYSRNPHLALGVSGGADSATAPTTTSPTFPFQASAHAHMEYTTTLLAPTTINLRASGATSAADTVIDYPFQLVIEEIPF